MALNNRILFVCVVSALVSALAAFSLWVSLRAFLPSLFVLPFVVSLPVFLCWRYCGRLPALASALLSVLLLNFMVPQAVVFFMALHWLVPSLFILLIADLKVLVLQGAKRPFAGHVFLPLSHIIAANALVSAITTLILAAFFINMPEVIVFLDDTAHMWREILRKAQLYSPQLDAQIAVLLKTDMIIALFAFYGFAAPLVNFYIVGRIERPGSQRPGDYWPAAASGLPRMSVALLIVSSLASLLPFDETVKDCLSIIAIILINAFILCGLAAIHLMSRGKNGRAFLLVGVYVFASLPMASIALAGLGVFASVTPLLQNHKKNNPPSI